MINATSQKRALKATPKLVFGVHLRPIVCGYACTTGKAYGIHSIGYPLCGGAPTKTSPLERKHQLKNPSCKDWSAYSG